MDLRDKDNFLGLCGDAGGAGDEARTSGHVDDEMR